MKTLVAVFFIAGMLLCSFAGYSQDIESGLVAYYPMDGDGTDKSMFERDLENYGAVPGADRFDAENAAMVFKGDEGTYMETFDIDGLPEEDFDRTLAAWVSVDTSTMKRAGVFIAYGTQEDFKHCHINTRPVDGGLFRFGFWGKNIDTHFSILEPDWVHIAVTLVQGNIATIYINGVVDTVDVIPDDQIPDTYLGAESLTIGAHNKSHPSAFSGSLDEVRIYNRALSADDIIALYEFDATEVKEQKAQPLTFTLAQNYPNPFNPQTTIDYTVSTTSHIRLSVYNVLGHEVAVLVSDVQQPGSYSTTFDASELSSGVYLYRLHMSDQVLTRKMMLMQ